MSDHRLAAVMVTDMVGFTALMGADQNNALRLLNRGHEILKSVVAAHSGEWIDDSGDRSLTAFPSALDAVCCALEIQSRIAEEAHLDFRIGVDVGEIIVSEGHIYGDVVNVASFIERLADPDGLVISEAVYNAIENELDLNVMDLGEKVLKNISRPVRLYALSGSTKRTRTENWLSGLMARRVPHVAGAYLAGSWAVIEVIEWLAEHEMIAQQWTYAVLTGLIVLIPSVLLFTYTHGAHGRDNPTAMEKVFIPLNVLLAGVLTILVYQNADVTVSDTPLQPASVAVLPFVNLTDDVEGDYFGLGLSEELINALARVPGLYVASRTSSFMFEDHDLDPRQIARHLRVATILEGSIRIVDDRVRVTAQLISGDDNFHLWSENFDRELADRFVIQEEIASAVAFNLVGVLQPDTKLVLASAAAESPEAYQYYLRGLSYLRQPPTIATLDSARDYLRTAIIADDGYAMAYAALCEVELEQYVLDRSSTAIDVAESACVEALEIDSRSREVRRALGVLYRHTGDYEQSEQMFRDLLRESATPNVLVALGNTLDAAGKVSEAESNFEEAIRMEPGNWHHRMALAEFYYWHCRYKDSLDTLYGVVRLSPDNVRARLILGAAYSMQGDTEAALRETMAAIDISPSRGAYRDLGWTYHYLGDYDKAVEAYLRALELGPNDYATWGSLGETYSQMEGQTDDALLAYARAVVLAEDLLARNPRDWLTMSRLAVYNVMIGAVDEGMERIKAALANRPDLSDIHYANAAIQTQLNNNDEAIDALERAVELGCYPTKLIKTDPRFRDLKDDARFMRLVSE